MATVVQYPCSQFTYITSGRTESESQELFEAWMAAHHPALLDLSHTIPRWETASYAPFNLQQDIVIVPPCCESFWSEDWEKQTADCVVIRNTVCREEIVRQILAERNCVAPVSEVQSFDDEFIADCYSFAAARLLVALLNKNVYYVQTPDESRLKTSISDALKAAKKNQPEDIKRAMQSAFDEIVRAKDTYHSAQNYFIELILATKTTVGEPLRKLLHESASINLFMPSSVLETLPKTHPDTFSLLKSAAEQNKVRFIVDDTEPQSLTLLPILDAADCILAGMSLYRELLNVSPKIYGRLTAGLSPALPQLLKLAELNGAIHFAPLDGWQVKENTPSKIVWQGMDNTGVDALVRYPIDATTYLGFFELVEQLSTQINQDSVPTSVFALFPGQKSVWLDILRRMNKYTTGLGEFVNIEEYFSSTIYSGGLHRFSHEQYPVNALTTVGQNPISRWDEFYRHSTNRLVNSSLETLLALLNRPAMDAPLAQQFADAVVPKLTEQQSDCVLAHPIAINPLSFPRKIYINDLAVSVPPLGYVYAEPPRQAEVPTKKDLPGQPFVSFVSSVAKKMINRNRHKKHKDPILARKAEDNLGRNERRAVYILENRYFSAKFDAATGALRSIFTNRSRYNQLSRQIAFRKNQTYTIPAAEEITITKTTPETGQLKIAGRLIYPDGEIAARFTEVIVIRSQSRLLEFDLTLEPLLEFDDDRWNSYLAVRYAWNDDTLEMCGNLNDGMYVLPDRKHLYSPKVIDLRHETGSLTFLSEGLPFHRRSGDRQLDTLLVVKGETHRQFRLGIAVNAQNPMFLSYDFALKQDEFIFPAACRPKNSSAWLFQIESNHVLALHWEPVLESEKLVGYMVYLQETVGRRAHFALRSFVQPRQASAMNVQGRELKTFKTDGDAVLIDMHAYELLPLKVYV